MANHHGHTNRKVPLIALGAVEGDPAAEVLQSFTSGLPSRANQLSRRNGETRLSRELQAQEQLKTKVLQTFTQAPQGRQKIVLAAI